MFGRSSLFLAMIVGGVAVPYLLSSSSGFTGFLASATPVSESHEGATHAEGGHELGAGGASNSTPVHPLEHVFRFDVTTAWVLQNWPRVSTGLSELNTFGYRVPLVTGTQADDLAGSLTYYFNQNQQVDRITFDGTTGDVRRLVQFLETQHGFQRATTDDPGLFLFQTHNFGDVASELKIRPAQVISADAPHSRFEVSLKLVPAGGGWF